MLIPSQIIITYVRPSLWLPSLEVVWGVITGLFAITKNAKQVYILRVFLGLCESTAYPGMITLFSTCALIKSDIPRLTTVVSWYTPLEMAKRIGFYHSCQAIGQIISGAMQAAIVKSLEGRHGLSGWRYATTLHLRGRSSLKTIGGCLLLTQSSRCFKAPPVTS